MRTLIFILIFACTSHLSYAQAVSLRVENSDQEIIIWAKSNLPCPCLLYASPSATDIEFQRFLPRYGERELIRLPADSADKLPYLKQEVTYSLMLGNPHAIPDKEYQYTLPFPRGKSYKLSQGNNGGLTHNTPNTRYAFDFEMPVGSPVTAARGGTVGYVQDSYDVGGNDISFIDKGNQILICHQDGTVAVYGHLKHEGALVGVGDKVFAGQVIGLSGNTGYSSTPHLHFAVMVIDESTPVQFRNLPEQLQQGGYYPQKAN